MDAQLASAFLVPPAMLGTPPEPRTREDAARVRLAYLKSMGLDPYDADDDVVLLVSTEEAWGSCVLSRDEALDRLAPLRQGLDALGDSYQPTEPSC